MSNNRLFFHIMNGSKIDEPILPILPEMSAEISGGIIWINVANPLEQFTWELEIYRDDGEPELTLIHTNTYPAWETYADFINLLFTYYYRARRLGEDGGPDGLWTEIIEIPVV